MRSISQAAQRPLATKTIDAVDLNSEEIAVVPRDTVEREGLLSQARSVWSRFHAGPDGRPFACAGARLSVTHTVAVVRALRQVVTGSRNLVW